MPYRLCAVALLAAGLTLALSARAEDKDKARDDKTIELFNGKNLTGWKAVSNDKGDKDADPKKTWTVNEKDKVLVCKGQPWGYLITEKDYGDYKLELEWRYPDTDKDFKGRRNSGVLLHCMGEGKPWPHCFEAQLLSGSAGDFWSMGLEFEGPKDQADEKNKGRHYFRKKTDKEVEKPLGEWNKYEITCKGDTTTLVVNGQEVNVAKNVKRQKGRIALQSEGAEIHFRNVRLTPLK